MTRIAVLTEEALAAADVEHILSLHPDAELEVLVPADTEQNLLASLVDHLSLGELREALDEVLGREPTVTPELTAAEQLERSLAAFAAAGATATGSVVDDDPLPALHAAVTDRAADEVIVVTTPHALEDTFHTDWASRARDELKVPVMHLYAGTSQLG
jgi:hypothetical protein